MKKIIDAIKDFIYNITDYGLIITVIVVMGAVLIWRFNILFNIDIAKEPMEDGIPAGPSQNVDVSKGENPNVNPDSTNKPETPPDTATDTEPTKEKTMASIEIPSGTYPPTIGDILLSAGLIKDKNEFLDRAIELKLDTKLQCGTFEIATDTPLDTLIKILAKVE